MCLERKPAKVITYKKPVAKTVIIKTFLLLGICNLQRVGMGSNRITKSDMTLKTPVAWNVALEL